MTNFPLVRRRWTNEHIMAALFIVLLLYMLPGWLTKPSEIASFIAVLLFSLVIDAVAGFIRYKRPVCSVSSAVTAGILQLLTPGIPLWGRLAGVLAALALGKHIWGGTGKNLINPALTGLLLLGFIFQVGPVLSQPSLLYLPAVLLSLPFIMFRPFAGIGLISGMALTMLSGGEYQVWAVAVNCIFYGCLIVTDPVTVTHKALPGLVGAFAAGLLTNSAFYLAPGILAFNLFSYLVDLRIKNPKSKSLRSFPRIKSPVPESGMDGSYLDLADKRVGDTENYTLPEAEEIICRIEKHGVFGMGGAGFSTAQKMRAFIKSDIKKKYFIINGVECDPGLIHDKWLMKNRIDEISRGIEVIFSCTGLSNAYLAVKDTSGITVRDDVQIVVIPDVYPAGAERILIEKVLGIKLQEDTLPVNEGILVLNVQTVLSVYDAVFRQTDSFARYITVSDLKNGKSMVARVRLGDRIHDILNKAYPDKSLAFAGGGLMQSHMADDLDVVDKSTNYIASASMPNYKESPQCSRCGVCTANCPAGLEAGRIAELVDKGKISETAVLMPERCLGCGSCSYLCLAGRNLSARVREAKSYVASEKNKQC